MPKKKQGISITEYAKREQITREMAYKRINSGKISKLADGSIDYAKAKQEWARNRDERQTRGAQRAKANKKDDDPDGPSLSNLQRGAMALKIKRDQIHLRRLENMLLDREEVRQAWGGMILSARAALLPIGGELADNLAAETDARKKILFMGAQP